MRNISELKWGSILSYLQMGLNILIGLVYTPLMIRLLGQSEYGLYNTVASTISMLSILNLGFNSSYIRYYAIYKHNDNQNSIWKLNGLFLLIFSAIGIVAFICGLFFTTHLELIFAQGLTEHEYFIAKILMFLMAVNLAFSFPMSVFSTIISANERFVFLKLIGMFNTVLSPLVTLPLLLLGYRSIAMVSVSVSLSFVVSIIYCWYVISKLKNKFIFKGFEKGLFKNLFSYTFFIAINLLIDQINWNIDKILLGRYKGTIEVAVYSVGYSLYSYYSLFSTSISSLFTPRIHKLINDTKGDLSLRQEKLTTLFTKVGRIQFLILGLICLGIIFWGRLFITRIWAGNDYITSYEVALLLIIPASIALIQNLGIEIQRAENKHQFRSITYLIMAVLNFVLSLKLCQKYGAVGSAIGTAISLVLANGIIINIYYHKYCNLDIVYFWKSIVKLSRGLIIPALFGILAMCFFPYKSIFMFGLEIMVYSVIYILSMWKFGMDDSEKMLFISFIKKFWRKI